MSVGKFGREEFAKLCRLMVSAFQKPMCKEMVDAYYMGLCDLELEVVSEGVYSALKTHEFHTIPTIAMIRRLGVGRTTGSEWAVALGRIMQNRSRLTDSFYRGQFKAAAEEVGRKGMMALTAIGGTKRLHGMKEGDDQALVSQFRDAYLSISQEMSGGQPLFGPPKLTAPGVNTKAIHSTEEKRLENGT